MSKKFQAPAKWNAIAKRAAKLAAPLTEANTALSQAIAKRGTIVKRLTTVLGEFKSDVQKSGKPLSARRAANKLILSYVSGAKAKHTLSEQLSKAWKVLGVTGAPRKDVKLGKAKVRVPAAVRQAEVTFRKAARKAGLTVTVQYAAK